MGSRAACPVSATNDPSADRKSEGVVEMNWTWLRRSICLCAILSFALLGVVAESHAQISIVVSKGATHNPSQDDVKAFFAAVKYTWSDGSKVEVVDQPETDLAGTFYTKLLGKSITQVRKEWTKLILSGQATAPVKCGDDEAVKRAVANSKNAIGYIATASLDGTVREIGKIE
jgi:hypothetical protein